MYLYGPPLSAWLHFPPFGQNKQHIFLSRLEGPHEVHFAYHPLCLMQRKFVTELNQSHISQGEVVNASLFDMETWTTSTV